MEKLKLYIKESYNELVHKVTWLSMPQLLSTTNVVIVGSLILTVLIFFMDVVSNTSTEFIYGLK